MEQEWETTRQRASKDTESFRKSTKSFWLLEIGGTAVLTFVGGYVGSLLMPQNPTPSQQYIYPGAGAAIGMIIGLVVVFALIYLWNLFRAPYRQRDEARRMVLELQKEKEVRQYKKQIVLDVNLLVIEGMDVLNAFKSGDSSQRTAWPAEKFKLWLLHANEVYRRHKLLNEQILWLRDVGIEVGNSSFDDVIQACENGLNRLEKILDKYKQ